MQASSPESVTEHEKAARPSAATPPDWLSVVRDQVRGLQFGIVQIVVHDSRVVQIERTERLRLAHSQPAEKGD